jgi:hypothetical protein
MPVPVSVSVSVSVSCVFIRARASDTHKVQGAMLDDGILFDLPEEPWGLEGELGSYPVDTNLEGELGQYAVGLHDFLCHDKIMYVMFLFFFGLTCISYLQVDTNLEGELGQYPVDTNLEGELGQYPVGLHDFLCLGKMMYLILFLLFDSQIPDMYSLFSD